MPSAKARSPASGCRADARLRSAGIAGNPARAATQGGPLADSIDLRPAFEKWQLDRRVQGKRNTCSVFTVTQAIEFALGKQHRRDARLSVEFLNWASNRVVREKRDGGFFSDLWRGFDRYGICDEEEMPYAAEFDASLRPSPAALAQARQRLDEAEEIAVQARQAGARALELTGPEAGGAVPDLVALLRDVREREILAKLAARYALGKNLSVGLITTDTYRIAAAEQLQVYGRIMNIPVAVAPKRDEFAEAVARFSDKDVILVDTPGRSSADEDFLADMNHVLSGDEPVQKELLLSLTSSRENMLTTRDLPLTVTGTRRASRKKECEFEGTLTEQG